MVVGQQIQMEKILEEQVEKQLEIAGCIFTTTETLLGKLLGVFDLIVRTNIMELR